MVLNVVLRLMATKMNAAMAATAINAANTLLILDQFLEKRAQPSHLRLSEVHAQIAHQILKASQRAASERLGNAVTGSLRYFLSLRCRGCSKG
jgi:hypothetical protein